jgi:hypothetical protein
MARARRQPAQSKSTEFLCPECERTFARAAALGAHRRRAHGVVGATSQARAKSSTRPRPTAARNTSTHPAAANGRRATSRASRRGSAARLNRDALLARIFPAGVPAREAVMRDANAWLDEAERLANMH